MVKNVQSTVQEAIVKIVLENKIIGLIEISFKQFLNLTD